MNKYFLILNPRITAKIVGKMSLEEEQSGLENCTAS